METKTITPLLPEFPNQLLTKEEIKNPLKHFLHIIMKKYTNPKIK